MALLLLLLLLLLLRFFFFSLRNSLIKWPVFLQYLQNFLFGSQCSRLLWAGRLVVVVVVVVDLKPIWVLFEELSLWLRTTTACFWYLVTRYNHLICLRVVFNKFFNDVGIMFFKWHFTYPPKFGNSLSPIIYQNYEFCKLLSKNDSRSSIFWRKTTSFGTKIVVNLFLVWSKP